MSNSKPKVMFVLTSHDTFDATGKPTGWYLPELAHPYYVLAPHAEITIASPAGGEAPLDANSVTLFEGDEEAQKFYREQSHLWKNTEKLSKFADKAHHFDMIYVVGGHGPLFDLTENATSQKLLADAYEAGNVVAAVCHGVAAFVHVKLSNGEYLIKDQPVTAFSNDEEETVGLLSKVPYKLEDALIQNGGKYEKAAEQWGAHVSVGRDGKLISGQNPASAAPLAKTFLKHWQSKH